VNPSDQELIARVLVDDDRAAFGELVRRHQSAVRAFLRQLTGGDSARADDLAQETFLQAHRSLAHFRADAAFSTWLLGIAHNQFRNERRRHQREIPQATTADSIDDTACSPAHQAALHQDLAAAIRQLSPDEQTVLHICYRQGLTHDEAANILGWPLGTVKTHIARAKDKLRLLLAAWNPQT
jgi:RNA polymerase sigma factor (sigma-70 family)